MSQNQRYKQKYDELRDGNPAMPEKPDDDAQVPKQEDVNYLKPGNNRNLAIVPLNEKMRAFNYAYFVTTEFDPNSDPNVLAIMFTSHTVIFKGYGLINLFWDLFNSSSRIVTAIDPRYVPEEQDKDSYTVTEISVEKNS